LKNTQIDNDGPLYVSWIQVEFKLQVDKKKESKNTGFLIPIYYYGMFCLEGKNNQ
jgi:hypothetical protein